MVAAAQVGARAEAPPGPGNEQRPSRRVAFDPIERVPDLGVHLGGEGIELLGPVEGECRQPVTDLEPNVGIAHGSTVLDAVGCGPGRCRGPRKPLDF